MLEWLACCATVTISTAATKAIRHGFTAAAPTGFDGSSHVHQSQSQRHTNREWISQSKPERRLKETLCCSRCGTARSSIEHPGVLPTVRPGGVNLRRDAPKFRRAFA